MVYVAAVEQSIVMRLLAAPRKNAPLPPVKVVVVAAVKFMVLVEPPVWVSSLNVLAPVIVTMPVPPVVIERILNTREPPAKVLALEDVLLRTIVEVPALTVPEEKFQGVPAPCAVHVPLPMLKVPSAPPKNWKELVVVRLKLLALNVTWSI